MNFSNVRSIRYHHHRRLGCCNILGLAFFAVPVPCGQPPTRSRREKCDSELLLLTGSPNRSSLHGESNFDCGFANFSIGAFLFVPNKLLQSKCDSNGTLETEILIDIICLQGNRKLQNQWQTPNEATFLPHHHVLYGN